MKASIFTLAIAAIGAAVAQAQTTNGFSVVIGSDPQFTWWRSSLDTACKSADCEKGKTQNYNTSLTQSMATAGSLVWPQDLPRGGGGAVLSPSAAIINGDLTSSWQSEEADLYKQYFPGSLHIPLFTGLGNHDYANNAGGCYFGGVLDKNLCAKQAVWYMAAQVDQGPLLVNRDLSGYVTLNNNAYINARLSVSWVFEGVRSSKTTDAIPGGGGKQSVILPPNATDVDVNIDWNNGSSWSSVQHYHLTRGRAACYSISGNLFSQSTSGEKCPTEWPTGSYGSMAYSFDIGKYHFVQLQLEPGYAVDLPEVNILLPYPGFSVKKSWAWLKKDLAAATAAGKYSVLNMHAFGRDLNDYPTDMPALQDALKGNTVVAIFSGHIHQDFGQSEETVMVDDSPVSVIDKSWKVGVPTFRSGSGECSRFLVAEFHDDYFNVGAAAANYGKPSWTTEVCDSRQVLQDVTVGGKTTSQVWGYASNSGDPGPMQFTLQRHLKVTTTAGGAASGPYGAVSGTIDNGVGTISVTGDWGDGASLSTSAYNNPPYPAQFQTSHLYAKDGQYTVTLLAKDGTGAAGTATATLTADGTPPVTKASLTSSGTGIIVTLTATDNLSAVSMTRYRLDNGEPATYRTPFPVPAGTNAVYFWSVDSLQNVEAIKTIQLPDTAPPVTKASAPPANPNGWYRTSPVPVTLTATDTGSGVKLMAIGVDGSFLIPITAPFPVSGDGKHQVPYYSVDNAGNVEAIRSLPIWIDTKPPVLKVTSPTLTLRNTSPYFWLQLPPMPVEITGTLTDTLSGVQPNSLQYTVKDSYGEYQPAGIGTNSPGGAFSLSVPLVPTLAGPPRVYTVTITGWDIAGNPASATATITL